MTMFATDPAVDALTLLARRVRDLPGLEVLDHEDSAATLGIAIGVRRTGLTGYGVVRRLRGWHGVRLEPHADRVIATFGSTHDVCDGGTRLLFGLNAILR